MSFVSYAADAAFPIQNLPFGVFVQNGAKHIGVAIGDLILDLFVLAEEGSFFPAAVNATFAQPTLNAFMALEHAVWAETRAAIASALSASSDKLQKNEALKAKALVKQADVQMVLPCNIGDYTDFYSSKEHATNLGKMFRPNAEPLLENWLHIPVGYHGRASSIVVSGTDLHRPNGQQRPNPEAPPVFGPCKLVDFELEMAAYVGTGNALGDYITVADARKKVFGFSTFNDWSARDIQKWEYVPLGPFLGKNFGSTISPWIVTAFALEPFQVAGPTQEPSPLPYLQEKGAAGNYDVSLKVVLETPKESVVLSNSNYKYMYWSVYQQLAHHSVNGCNMNAGDVFASGTLSGPVDGSYGSMLELCWQGTKPLTLPGGEVRKMVADGDTIHMTAECKGDGYTIGFGPCSTKILPAKTMTF
jgi:fumarylacetoacetase